MVQHTFTFTKYGAEHRSLIDVHIGEGHCSMCKLQGMAVMAIEHHHFGFCNVRG